MNDQRLISEIEEEIRSCREGAAHANYGEFKAVAYYYLNAYADQLKEIRDSELKHHYIDFAGALKRTRLSVIEIFFYRHGIFLPIRALRVAIVNKKAHYDAYAWASGESPSTIFIWCVE